MALYRKRFKGRALREFDVVACLRDELRKQSYVTFMFDLLAPGYNAFTRTFSFGMDRRWKRWLVDAVAARVSPSGRLADLACGTADIAYMMRHQLPDASVVGVDISSEMIRVAEQLRGARSRPVFVIGDVSRLCLATGTMTGVTIGYGLRNLPSLDGGLSEIHRVLSPGGTIAILDFFVPRLRIWRFVFLAYLFVFGAVAGWLWHRDSSTFTYIPRSIRRFVTIDDLVVRLRRAGFDVVTAERRLGGGIGLLLANKASFALETPGGLLPAGSTTATRF